MDLDKYKQQTRPNRWRSKMDAYRTEILSLHGDGYSLAQVAEWLKSAHQIEVSRQAIGEFIHRRTAAPTNATAPAAVTKTAVVTTPNPAPAAEKKPGEPKRFDWNGLKGEKPEW